MWESYLKEDAFILFIPCDTHRSSNWGRSLDILNHSRVFFPPFNGLELLIWLNFPVRNSASSNWSSESYCETSTLPVASSYHLQRFLYCVSFMFPANKDRRKQHTRRLKVLKLVHEILSSFTVFIFTEIRHSCRLIRSFRSWSALHLPSAWL